MWHRCGPSCLCSDSQRKKKNNKKRKESEWEDVAVKIILPFKTFDCLLVLWFSNDKVTNTEKLVCVCVCVDVFWWKIDYCSLLCTNTGVRRPSSESWEEERGEECLLSLAVPHSWLHNLADIQCVGYPSASASSGSSTEHFTHGNPRPLIRGLLPPMSKKTVAEQKKRAKIQLSELSLKQNKWLEG